MGEVYLAEDAELHRKVALNEILIRNVKTSSLRLRIGSKTGAVR
jgi:hypothetical protein